MSPRDLAFRLVTLVAYAVIVATAVVLTILYRLSIELADEVKASRQTNNRFQGWKMSQKKNTRLTDSVSMMRAANAVLAARVGDTARAQAVLAEAEFYAGNASIPMRRAS